MILDFDSLMYPHPPSRDQQGGRRKPYGLDRMRQAYVQAFSSDNGKVVLADIARRGLLHTFSFTGETPLSTAFNEGKRALALEIIYLLNPNPVHNIKGEAYDRTTQLEFDARGFD
jgi:hypothetical protein